MQDKNTKGLDIDRSEWRGDEYIKTTEKYLWTK